MSALSALFLSVFVIIMFSSYILIRRDLLPLPTAGILCGVGTITSVFAFGMAEDLQLVHALVLSIVVGLMFTGAMLVMAAFFQANQPEKAELEAYLKDQETRSSE